MRVKITPRRNSRMSPFLAFLACLAMAVHTQLSIRPIGVLVVLLAREKKRNKSEKTGTVDVEQQVFPSENVTENISTINVYGLRSIADVDEDFSFLNSLSVSRMRLFRSPGSFRWFAVQIARL